METIKDTARVWVFGANRSLTDAESTELIKEANQFCRDWTAHKVALHATADVLHHTFLVISVDEEVHGASGCSIDAMHKFVRNMEKRYGVNFFDRLRIVYLKDDNVKNVTLREFEELYEAGEVNAQTRMFNSLVNSGIDLQEKFLVPVAETWIAGRLRL